MILKGWMGKDKYRRFMISQNGVFGTFGIPILYKTKDTKGHWDKDDWPPVKVEVEIREV